MALMTGPEMLEHVKLEDFSVVIITANPKHETDLRDTRIKAFLTKPVFESNFRHAIEALQ